MCLRLRQPEAPLVPPQLGTPALITAAVQAARQNGQNSYYQHGHQSEVTPHFHQVMLAVSASNYSRD